MTNVKLKIEGMSCAHCALTVDKALKAIPGVADAKVEVGSAQVSFDPEKATVEKMKAAVAEEGYKVVGTGA
jgi:copper chaperone